MNDVAYDGVSSDQGLTYLSTFGDIYKGEKHRTLLTLINVSRKHKVERVKVTVIINRQKSTKSLQGNGEKVILNVMVDSLECQEQRSFPLTFAIEYEDTYILHIEMKYTSKHFADYFGKKLQEANGDMNRFKNLTSTEHSVEDPATRFVVKKQRKLYEFQAVNPFGI